MDKQLTAIGSIHTPYNHISECPNNIDFEGMECEIRVFEAFHKGLIGLQSGDQILLLYWLGQAERLVETYASNDIIGSGEKGTFALRAPCRPNPIGVAVVTIEALGNGIIKVRGLDCLNGTELLDIKPAIYREV